ncbi:hypothetical protein ACFL2C_02550 [Patescibacteria group bacterium]
MGGLVDEVRTFYSQESRSKEIIKQLLLINGNEIASKYSLMSHK